MVLATVAVCFAALVAQAEEPIHTSAERAAKAAQRLHERELRRLDPKGYLPVAWLETVLVERDEAIRAKERVLRDLEATKPKGNKANSQWSGKFRKKTISLQRARKARLEPVKELPQVMHPREFTPGKVGMLWSMRVTNVQENGDLTVYLNYSKKNGTKLIQTPLGPQVVDRFVQDTYGPGVIEGLPANDLDKEGNALNGIYQVIEGKDNSFRLKWLGAVKR